MPGACPRPTRICGGACAQWSRKAIASIVLALISLAAIVQFFEFFTEDLSNRFLLSALFAASIPPVIILGHGAKAALRRSSGRIVGERIATTGLVLGYSGLVVSVILARRSTLPPYDPWGLGTARWVRFEPSTLRPQLMRRGITVGFLLQLASLAGAQTLKTAMPSRCRMKRLHV